MAGEGDAGEAGKCVPDRVAIAAAAELLSGGEDDGRKCSALVAIVPTVGDEGCAKGTAIVGGELAVLLVSVLVSVLSSTLVEEEDDEASSAPLVLCLSFFPNRLTDGFFSSTGVL